MKSRFGLVTMLGMLALVMAAPPVMAQTADDVQRALERTDEKISQAEMVLAGGDNAQAQAELDAAKALQTQARAAYDQGVVAAGDVQLRLFRQSVDLTLRARLRADRAISLIRGLPDPYCVLMQLERTRELLERARDRIEECDIDRARALLRAAFEMQVRAEAAARDGRYLAALQLTMSARERGHRALRMCNLEDNLRDAAERALARTDELISRARDLVAEHDSEQARHALNRAIEVEAEALAQFRADHFEASLRLTQSARTFAHRAIRLAGAR
jgi:hypothetical protein